MRRWNVGLPLVASVYAFSAFAMASQSVAQTSTDPVKPEPGVTAAPIAPIATAPQPAEAVREPATPVAAAILAQLSQLQGAAKSAAERTWLQRLDALYRTRVGEPLWVDGNGMLPKAQVAAEALSLAGEWGLEAGKLGIPTINLNSSDAEVLARGELELSLAVVRYAAYARGHRFEPSDLSKWLDVNLRPVDAGEIVTRVAGAADTADALRRFHPQHPEFERLRQAYLKSIGNVAPPPQAAPEPAKIPAGPKLRPGATHPHIAILRERLGVAVPQDQDENYYDQNLAAALRKFLSANGRSVTSTLNDAVRTAINSRGRAEPQPSLAGRALQRKLLANMERWRWLPDDLGTLHVWNNLPEFETRVVKGGEIIHQERIVIGKTELQTPVFSDAMRFVVFQPEWGVPPTIKVKDLLPKLQSGDSGALERRNMRIVINGKEKDPDEYDWDKTDIRKIPIVQYAGDDNPLGTMKFMFPNKHDVYMHDTPTKSLFNAASRTFSSGCIRVRNPQRLAELVFNLDRGWSPNQVSEAMWKGDQNKRIDLERRIPVHMTYFTVRIGADGKMSSFNDVYGHDKRVLDALDGRPIREIAAEDPALKHAERVEELASRSGSSSGRSNAANRDGWDRRSGSYNPYFAPPSGRGYQNGYGAPNQRARYPQAGGYYPPPKSSNGFLGGIFGF